MYIIIFYFPFDNVLILVETLIIVKVSIKLFYFLVVLKLNLQKVIIFLVMLGMIKISFFNKVNQLKNRKNESYDIYKLKKRNLKINAFLAYDN